MKISKKQILPLAFVLMLVMLIPVAIFMSQKQQEIRSKAAGPATVNISDDFSGASLDTSKWTIESGNPAGTVSLSAGKLQVTTQNQTVNNLNTTGIFTNTIYSGDFAEEVEVNSLSVATGNSGTAEIAINNVARTSGINLAWRKNSSGSYVDLNTLATPSGQVAFTTRHDVGDISSLKLKLIRIGTTAYGYTDTGSGYQLIGTLPNAFAGDGIFIVHAFTFNNSTGPITSSFDNFSATIGNIDLPTPTPTPIASCITLPTNELFNGSSINSNFWNNTTDGGGSTNVSNNALNTSLPGGVPSHAGVTSSQVVCGDFDISVNFNQFTSSGQNEGDLLLRAQDYATDAGWATGSDVSIQRYEKTNEQGFWTAGRVSGVNFGGFGVNSITTTGKLRIRRIGNVFTTYYDDGSGNGWKLQGTYTKSLSTSLYITLGVFIWDQNPSISAKFSNVSFNQAIPDPSITPPPATPTLPAVPTPPSGADKYTIDVGNKQSLAINIAAAVNPLIRFKAKLGSVRATPDLYFRLRVRDEAASVKNPTQSVTDACTNPPPSDHDYYIPVHATGGVYSGVAQNSSTVPTAPGATVASVSADGWITLDGILPGKYYTLYLKGPKTRKSRMVQHVLLQPGQISPQDFDWSANTLDPGDLPDPNNASKQDCVINATDWSLLQSRIGSNDAPALSVCDVNYDGICNAGDSVAILNTLSTRPDDDQ